MKADDFIKRGDAVMGTSNRVNGSWLRRFAGAIGKDYATVKRWAAGDLAVPAYAVAIIELMERCPFLLLPDRFDWAAGNRANIKTLAAQMEQRRKRKRQEKKREDAGIA